MKIDRLTTTSDGALTRVSAQMTWEDVARPPQEVYFETGRDFASALACNPNAFLIGCLPPAMRAGERRVRIEAPVCPVLLDRVQTAMAWFAQWYGPSYRAPALEAAAGRYTPQQPVSRRTGLMFSGGVDSLFTLQRNRATIARSYPGAIEDAFLVHGFEMYRSPDDDRHEALFARAMTSMQEIADDAGLTLIPLSTNVRHLEPTLAGWMDWFFGAALASVAHAFAPRISRMYVASGAEIPQIRPWGSHPLIDANYSAADVQIQHDGERYTRLEKLNALRTWPVALRNLRVCVSNPQEGTNCGRCEKCVRTMLELVAAEAPEGLRAFGRDELSADAVSSMKIRYKHLDDFYGEMLGPLQTIGRTDLVAAIRERLADRDRVAAWQAGTGWKGRLKRFDSRYLGGAVAAALAAVRGVPRDQEHRPA